MKEVVVKIRPGGKTEVSVNGVKGPECLETTQPFEDALGEVEKRVSTDELQCEPEVESGMEVEK